MGSFHLLSKSQEFIQVQQTIKKFNVKTVNEQKISVIARKRIEVDNIYTISKEPQEINHTIDRTEKRKKLLGNFIRSIIGFDETIDTNFSQFLGRKIQQKVSQQLKRKELEDHTDRKRRPSIADGLFAVFFPEIFVLEVERKALNKELAKVGSTSRKITSDIKILAKSLVRFTCSSVKSCKTIGAAAAPVGSTNKKLVLA